MPELRKLRQVRDVTNIRAASRPIKRKDYALPQKGFKREIDPAFETLAAQELESRAMPAESMPGASTILERVVYKALHDLGYRPPDLDFQSSMMGARYGYQFGRQIADIVIHSLGVIIEIQGQYWHDDADQKNRDAERELQLRAVRRYPPWRVFYLDEWVIRNRFDLDQWLLDHVVFAGLRSEWRSSSAAAVHSTNPFYPVPEEGEATPPDGGGGGGGGTPVPNPHDFSQYNPTNHLINGGFDHTSLTGWTTDAGVTATVVNGKLNLNATVAGRGVYQLVSNLEPSGTYYLACKVMAGGNSARFYTSGGLINPDQTVSSASEITASALCQASAAGDLTVHLVATTTGVDVTFDNVILVRGNTVWAWGVHPHADTVDGYHAKTSGADAHVIATDASGNATVVDLTASGKVRTTTIDTASGNLVLDPAANVDLASAVALGTDNYVSQTTGWRGTYAGGLDVRHLFTDELHAKSFIADLEQALAGGQIVCKSVAVVAAAFTIPAAGAAGTLIVEDLPGASAVAVFQTGDIVRLRQFTRTAGTLTIADCWGVVTLYADNGDGTQDWTYTRSAGAAGGTAVAGTAINAKTLALDYGVTGNGFYEVNAIDGAWAANSPYAQIVTWATHPQSGQVVRSRWGNLKGVFSVANEFGFYAGDGVLDASKYLRISSQTVEAHNLPVKMYDGASATIALDPTAPSMAMGSTLPSAYGTGDGLWMGKDAGAYKFRVGAITGSMLIWTGASVYVQADANNYLRTNGTSLQFYSNAVKVIDITNTPSILIGQEAANQSNVLISAGAINLRNNTTNKIVLGSDGNISLTGALAVGTAGDIHSGATAVLTGNGYWLDYNAGTPRFRIGTITTGALTKGIYWDGANLQWKATNTSLDASGNLSASSATLSGAITATSGSITGTLTMPAAGSAIAIGVTPPTSSTAGTGIWIDRTGMYGLAANVLQAKFDAVTGAITAGAGGVTLDTTGIALLTKGQAQTTYLAWKDILGTVIGQITTRHNDGVYYDSDTFEFLTYLSGPGSVTRFGVNAFHILEMEPPTLTSRLKRWNGASWDTLQSWHHNGCLFGTGLTVSGGLNVGSATGAATGEISATSSANVVTWMLKNSKATDPSLAQIAVLDSAAKSVALGRRDPNDATYTGYGAAGDAFIYTGSSGNGFNVVVPDATNGILRFFVGTSANPLTNARLTVLKSGRVLIGTTTDDGANLLQVNGSIQASTYLACLGQLYIKDAMTAPGAVAGYAVIYVDSADGDLKVKFADGVTKTLAADT